MNASILQGDVLARLAEIQSDSVQCCVTSPPYWGLRSYDENAVRIDSTLDHETLAWLLAELERRGIHAE